MERESGEEEDNARAEERVQEVSEDSDDTGEEEDIVKDDEGAQEDSEDTGDDTGDGGKVVNGGVNKEKDDDSEIEHDDEVDEDGNKEEQDSDEDEEDLNDGDTKGLCEGKDRRKNTGSIVEEQVLSDVRDSEEESAAGEERGNGLEDVLEVDVSGEDIEDVDDAVNQANTTFKIEKYIEKDSELVFLR